MKHYTINLFVHDNGSKELQVNDGILYIHAKSGKYPGSAILVKTNVPDSNTDLTMYKLVCDILGSIV